MDDPSKLGVTTQPQLNVLHHTYRVLVCWCMVGVYLCCYLVMLVCADDDPSQFCVSTQPQLNVLHQAYRGLVCWYRPTIVV